ncbi:hypothetical protein BC826DRAFT_632230 [Russula brevipes]|nr:hypothetical protein BC826DRAFT_632230 [Russula brevipes]
MVGRPSVRSATMSPFGSTFMLTGIVIKSDPHGPYKLSPVMELFVDGEPRTATFRLREAQSTLSWKVKPAIAITAKSIISIQPYEAHGRDRRRKAEAVNVQGDAILRFCSSRPGDKHDFERAYVGFSVLLSIATQEDSKVRFTWVRTVEEPTPNMSRTQARDKARGHEDRAASPGGNGQEIFFSPATAPNSFKRSLDSLHGLMELIPPYSGLYETARETRDALRSACISCGADVQSLGEQVHDLLVDMQLPKFAERLISQTWTVTYILNLVRNAALFAEDCANVSSKVSTVLSIFPQSPGAFNAKRTRRR